MRIAQVCPLFERVPPRYYGGTERVVSYLTEELVRQGHDVTLFASGDSLTQARLVPCCDEGLRLGGRCQDATCHHLAMVEEVYRRASDFDIVHFHIDYIHFPATRREQLANITTLHGRLDIPDLVPLYRKFRDMPLVSISNAQRKPLPWANWQATVYHGLPLDLFRFEERAEDYLVFLGRISPEKRPDLAIEIARRADRELRIAAKVDRADREYFEEHIQPLFRLPHVTYLGEVGGDQKAALLAKAAGMLFPIDWPEPFGLVMIESMACGTPVIAFPRGSVPEVINDGLTGFICRTVEEAVEAVRRLPQLNRRRCREVFERRFNVSRMAADYLKVYQQMIELYASNGPDHSRRKRIFHAGHLAAWGTSSVDPGARRDVCSS
jgi:glycosyltransferase involved in cell wall biosynthesis